MLKKLIFSIILIFFLIPYFFSCQQISDIRDLNNSEIKNESSVSEIENENGASQAEETQLNLETTTTESMNETITCYISENIPESIKALITSELKKRGKNLNKAEIEILNNKVSSKEEDSLDADYLIDFNKYGDDKNEIGNFVLAFVSGFYTYKDNIVFDDFLDFWKGNPESLSYITNLQEAPNLILERHIYEILESIFGKYEGKRLRITDSMEEVKGILSSEEGVFSIIPFEQISKELKVFEINSCSVFDKKEERLEDYELELGIGVNPEGDDTNGYNLFEDFDSSIITNRHEDRMTTLMMTGCTALVRGTANRMEQKGVTYPGEKIADTLKSADITHISNEITFVEGNPRDKEDRIVFSSDPKYIELLRFVGTDVVELTGNHMNDYGPKWMVYTLEMYEKEGWQYFAGGRNLEESYKPAKFDVNGNKIAFLGCNQFGPESYWATEDKAGAAPPNYEDYEKIISELKKEGYIVIFTFSHQEIYDYKPSTGQIQDFRRMASAGADIVSGSQAHHPQAIEFFDDSIIFYGLGNLFFDQMYNIEVRQGIITEHIFYEGKHINTVLITTMLEDYCQPRLTDETERYEILYNVFGASDIKQ